MKEWMMASDGSGYTADKDPNKPGSFAACIYPYDSSTATPVVSGTLVESLAITVGGSRNGTTAQQMEVAGCGYGLAAFLRGLKLWGIDPKGVVLHIVLDSQYVYCAFNRHPTKPEQGFWWDYWSTHEMRTKSGKPVENPQLWNFLVKNINALKEVGVILKWNWVEGHVANSDVKQRLNNRVDSSCTSQVLELRSSNIERSAWYKVVSSGQTPETWNLPCITTPELEFHTKYDNMFSSGPNCKVVTVNKVGVMGAGLAKEFADLYTEGLAFYKHHCAKGSFKDRRVITWWHKPSNNIFFLAATKDDWRNPSQKEWVYQCAREIGGLYEKLKIPRNGVCIPPMGCGKGGLVWKEIRTQVIKDLGEIPILLFESGH